MRSPLQSSAPGLSIDVVAHLTYSDLPAVIMISLHLIHGKSQHQLGRLSFNQPDLNLCISKDDTDGQYRGTGNTLPFSCVDNDLEANILLNELILGNSSDVALGRLWARGAINADNCFKMANETGRLIGTAFVARDLMRVIDALEEDGMLRYWGE